MSDNPWAAYNRELKQWARVTQASFRSRIQSDTGALRQSIAVKTFNDDAAARVAAIRFYFARHGVFLELGVGNNRPAGTAAAERAKKPWLAPTLQARIGELERIVQAHSADAISQQLGDIIPTSIKIRMR